MADVIDRREERVARAWRSLRTPADLAGVGPRTTRTDYLDFTPDARSRPDQVSAADDTAFHDAAFGALLLDNVPLARYQTVLDIACGTGFPLFELAHRLGTLSRITGCDTSPAALTRAALKRRIHRRPDVGLTAASPGALPFKDASVDLIVWRMDAARTADPLPALRECARVLRRGGRLFAVTTVVGYFGELYQAMRQVLVELDRPAALGRLREDEESRGTTQSWARLLRQAGLRGVRRVEGRVAYRFAGGTALLRHPAVREHLLPGWRRALLPAEERPIFARLETALNDEAARAGELRMSVPLLLLEAARMQERSADPRANAPGPSA